MTFGVKYLSPLVILIFIGSSSVQASGISVDAGLTPGQGRWMFRTQYRYMNMQNNKMEMQNHIIPMVIAYGVSRNITLMTRAMYVNRYININKTIQKKGFNDLYLLMKIKVFRENTRDYILGIAPYIASNIPIGNSEISERTWDPAIGISMSWRPRPYSIDLTSSYTLTDAFNKSEGQEKDDLSLNLAFSSTMPIKNSTLAISPVIEFNYFKEINTNDNKSKNQEVLFLSPGVMLIKSSIIVEVLYQNPFSQKTNESLMKSKSRILLGLRYMF